MKLETVALRTQPIVPLLRCPLCGGALTLEAGRSLLCPQRHCYDLSAKGYVNFAPGHDQRTEKYGAALFESRSRIFAGGFYAPVAQAVADAVAQAVPAANPVVADVGCGEGYYARELVRRLPQAVILGVDLSREAVLAAARQAPGLHWLVGDLTRLPFQDASVDVLVDVLTPADYREFQRVLKPGGVLVKVIPADGYLAQIRQAVAAQLRNATFSNARVVEHLEANARVIGRQTVCHTLPVTAAQAADFLRMTPLTFGLSDAQREQVHFATITVALEVLICRLESPPSGQSETSGVAP